MGIETRDQVPRTQGAARPIRCHAPNQVPCTFKVRGTYFCTFLGPSFDWGYESPLSSLRILLL